MIPRSRRPYWLLPCLLLTACSANDGPATDRLPAKMDTVKSNRVATEKIIISTAASTTETMERLAAAYAARSQVEVKINPGSSSGLANQILDGAPADLFLSANRRWAEAVEQAGLAHQSLPLLSNRLVLVVPAGNPARVNRPQDLSSEKVKKIALAGENVPAGEYAGQALGKLGLLKGLSSKIARAQDVRGALAFVERGEAEAGIVYSTDVVAARDVDVVFEFDPSLHDEIVYILVWLKHGGSNPSAAGFYEFLQSPEADRIYRSARFERVPNQ